MLNGICLSAPTTPYPAVYVQAHDMNAQILSARVVTLAVTTVLCRSVHSIVSGIERHAATLHLMSLIDQKPT